MNLHDALVRQNQRREKSALVTQGTASQTLAEVRALLHDQGTQEEQLIEQLGLYQSLVQISTQKRHRWLNKKFEGDVYHADDVRRVCINYRMRMLPSHRYQGFIDPEFGPKLRRFQQTYHLTATDLEHGFYIVAPHETFDLQKRQRPLVDPLLLYRIDHQHYKLVHQWGGDLHPLRYLRAWRHRSLATMTIYWTVFTLLLTSILFGLLAESPANALTIVSVFTFLVGWGYHTTLRDDYNEQQHRFSSYNWDQDWRF